MKTRRILLQLAICALLVAAVAHPPSLVAAEAPTKSPVISKIALALYLQGEIAKEELEKERGGSGLRYSFDIKQGPATHEVGIDAMTGKVLEKVSESAKDEAAKRANETSEKD